MKSTKILSLIGLIAGLGWSSALATIDLTSYGSQPGNSGAGTIDTWATTLVNNYNAANAALPLPDTSYSVMVTGSTAPTSYPDVTGQTSITIPAGSYDYIALHWGNGQTTYPYQFYYIGNDTGSVTFTNNQNGLSWYALWGPTPSTPNSQAAVPEPSTWLAGGLLVLPLAIGAVRQFRRQRLTV